MIHFTNGHLTGLLPSFFSEHDPRSAREQLHTGYAHGGGVQPFSGFLLGGNMKNPPSLQLDYPGDRPMRYISHARLGDELIVVFEYSWVAIIQPDGDLIITRCD